MTQPLRLRDQVLSATELKAHAPARNRYHFNASNSAISEDLPMSNRASSGVLKGVILTEKSASGVITHMTNAVAMKDFIVETSVEPCVRMLLFFDGENRFQYGPHTVTFSKDSQRAKVVVVRETAPCRMQIRQGDRRCGLYISVPLNWFAQQGLHGQGLQRILSSHLSISDWSLPRHLWLQARQLLDAPTSSPAGKLGREAFALSLLSEWLLSLEDSTQESMGFDSRQGLRFCQLMAQEECWSLSLDDIGHQLGMSTATLQRYAHEHLGMSLTQYLRKQRLNQACRALYLEQVSIMEAALVAGYNHPNNFSAAFKRQFGVSPNEVTQHSLNALLSSH